MADMETTTGNRSRALPLCVCSAATDGSFASNSSNESIRIPAAYTLHGTTNPAGVPNNSLRHRALGEKEEEEEEDGVVPGNRPPLRLQPLKRHPNQERRKVNPSPPTLVCFLTRSPLDSACCAWPRPLWLLSPLRVPLETRHQNLPNAPRVTVRCVGYLKVNRTSSIGLRLARNSRDLWCVGCFCTRNSQVKTLQQKRQDPKPSVKPKETRLLSAKF